MGTNSTLFEYSNGYGNRAIHKRRSLVNGILYVVKTAYQWRILPKEFSPMGNGVRLFPSPFSGRYMREGLTRTGQDQAVKNGRSEHSSLLIVDAQSVKNAGNGEQIGFDGGNKNQGSETPDCR
jgi:putative transposase